MLDKSGKQVKMQSLLVPVELHTTMKAIASITGQSTDQVYLRLIELYAEQFFQNTLAERTRRRSF
jgi:hypothetical protein